MSLEQLVLLRHGETDWNIDRRMQGHRDVPLNDTGRAQIDAAAPSVAAMAPDVIVSSDLSRTMETAQRIASECGAPLQTDRRLRETFMGQWEGLTRDTVMDRWPDEWAAWRTTGAEVAPPGGESRVEVAERAANVVEDLDRTDASRALLVTHGGLIVGLVGLLLGVARGQWNVFEGIGNGHWVVLHRQDTWRLNTYNGGFGDLVLPDEADGPVQD